MKMLTQMVSIKASHKKHTLIPQNLFTGLNVHAKFEVTSDYLLSFLLSSAVGRLSNRQCCEPPSPFKSLFDKLSVKGSPWCLHVGGESNNSKAQGAPVIQKEKKKQLWEERVRGGESKRDRERERNHPCYVSDPIVAITNKLMWMGF